MSYGAAWPTLGDYKAAVQNPQNCFSDPELRSGRARVDKLGMPIGAAGQFAVVFQIETVARLFAVRCFTRPVVDQQLRYEALSHHLRGVRVPSLVDFAYQPQGVRVRGQWYPIVRMEWAEGEQLHQFLGRHLQQPQVLDQLAGRWRSVVDSLVRARMAHGDLQHGNVLVDRAGEIRLVDYDGVFIAALRDIVPNEVGHPNYQHPQRIQHGYYEENADAFSALVIYLSITALRLDPDLWGAFHAGENLIFTAKDFQHPRATALWNRLQAEDRLLDWSSSLGQQVVMLSFILGGACTKSVLETASLENIFRQTEQLADHFTSAYSAYLADRGGLASSVAPPNETPSHPMEVASAPREVSFTVEVPTPVDSLPVDHEQDRRTSESDPHPVFTWIARMLLDDERYDTVYGFLMILPVISFVGTLLILWDEYSVPRVLLVSFVVAVSTIVSAIVGFIPIVGQILYRHYAPLGFDMGFVLLDIDGDMPWTTSGFKLPYLGWSIDVEGSLIGFAMTMGFVSTGLFSMTLLYEYVGSTRHPARRRVLLVLLLLACIVMSAFAERWTERLR